MFRYFSLLTAILLVSLFAFPQQGDPAAPLEQFEEIQSDSIVTSLSPGGTSSMPVAAQQKQQRDHEFGDARLYWALGILAATVIAGLMVRYQGTRQLRPLFLVSSLVVLGFFEGGCPCIVESFQKCALMGMGWGTGYTGILYFAALIPIAYLFGRVYCGWICPLGALQELMFRVRGSRFMQSPGSQVIMRRIRVLALLLLILQLLITHTILYRLIDPFRSIFNFYSMYSIGWVLVGVIVLSSVLIFRPFCKLFCPAGLIFGWVSRLPGASVIGVKDNCISCKKCNQECEIRAITREGKMSRLNNQECIRCGSCLSTCPKGSLTVARMSKEHPVIVDCTV